jgi:hypothetical protein
MRLVACSFLSASHPTHARIAGGTRCTHRILDGRHLRELDNEILRSPASGAVGEDAEAAENAALRWDNPQAAMRGLDPECDVTSQALR